MSKEQNLENKEKALHIGDIMRPLFITNVEKLLLSSKRFRKCDWQNLDGINYIRMMDTRTLALAIRDIIKELNNGA